MQAVKNLFKLTPLTIVLSLVLTACGGGGSSSSSSSSSDSGALSSVPTAADVVITEENSTQVAASSIERVYNDTSSTSADLALPFGADITGNEPSLSMTEVVKMLSRLKLPQASEVPSGVEVQENCDVGSVSGSYTIEDTENAFGKAGNNAQINFSNCQYLYTYSDGNKDEDNFSGSASFKVLSSNQSQRVIEFSLNNYSQSYKYTDTANNGQNSYHYSISAPALTLKLTEKGGYVTESGYSYFNSAETTTVLTGKATFNNGGTTLVGAYNQLEEKLRDGYTAMDGSYEDQGYYRQYSLNGLMGYTKNSESYGVVGYQTLAPFIWDSYNQYPSSGETLIKGKTGKLHVTVQDSTNVFIETDANDDGAYEVSQVITWSELSAAR